MQKKKRTKQRKSFSFSHPPCKTALVFQEASLHSATVFAHQTVKNEKQISNVIMQHEG